MKKIIISAALLAGLTLSTGCNDAFMDKSPVTEPTEDTFFKSYADFTTYIWPSYHALGFLDNNGDVDAGYLERKGESGFNPYAYQTVSSVASGNGWDFSRLRRINLMLSHIEDSNMNRAEKDHWRAVGYFFFCHDYMRLLNRFGDVPFVKDVLPENAPEAYGPRTPRKEVGDSIMGRLKWAEEHIGNFEKKDGKNSINQDCIRVLISRFGLREGTWRKYHELGDYQSYFDESTRASKLLIDKYNTLYQGTDGQPAAGYGEIFTTEDLGTVPGIILYKQFVQGINGNAICRIEHTSSHNIEMNQNTVDLYLMKNGKPIHNSASGYHGDKDMYSTFRDRDPRMYHTIIPPYKVKPGKGEYPTWSFTGEAADREYIDIMGLNESCSNPGVGMKRLPGQNWSASLVPEIPRLGTGSFVSCRSGYYTWKNWDQWEDNNQGANSSDKPILKIEEVILNYAEAMWESGKFNQAVADESINRLRDRAGVARMNVAEINDSFDPNRGKYYPKGNNDGIKVDPVLWEIRRERIIELMGEGFGFTDIRRWRMAPWFLNRVATGLWTTKEFVNKAGYTLYNPETGFSDGKNGSMKEGYIFLFNDPLREGKGWLEKYYLYQVPTTEIVLNPALAPNNPGWESTDN